MSTDQDPLYVQGDVRPMASARDFDPHTRSLGRYLAMAGAVLAIGLIWGFYIVVAGIVHRAAAGREEARAAADRKVVCSAFSTPSARDLCALTIASHESQKGIVHALYQPSSDAHERVTASLH